MESGVSLERDERARGAGLTCGAPSRMHRRSPRFANAAKQASLE